MNRIVETWNRSQQPEYNGPDSVKIDGQEIQLEENEEMAVRKKPHTEAILDNTPMEKSKIIKELPKNQFDSIILSIKRATLPRVHEIRTITFNTLKRLKVKRDKTKAVNKLPKKGSHQVDVGSFKNWTDKITNIDKESVRQLIVIDATCVARG